jgi:5-(carboxyamino)imidazole ribonucleotide synthase
MPKKFTSKKIGFLGGGQLAQMLALRAHEMGHIPFVLSANSTDPAAQVVRHWQQGNVYSVKDLQNFLEKIDVVTFESEFIDIGKLKQARKNQKVKAYPSLANMKMMQDRFSQKKSLIKYELPTSPFIKVSNYNQARKAADFFNGPFVLKQRFHGYDGYGTFVIHKRTQLHKMKSQIEQNPHGFIAEKFIPFQRELAITVVRSSNKSLTFLPLVESLQQNSRCLWVKGPVNHSKIASLKKKIQNYVESINYVGAIAFELFDCGKQLLINEIAPRVHNSAHYSQDALNYDQFELHLLAITQQSLPKVKSFSPGFAMYNLLGTKTTSKIQLSQPPQCHLHWYHKIDSRPGRKMGHINCLSSSADKALKHLKDARKGFKL